jgi:ubiquinone/menaquinone biosynthesis C-methylase UbiE
MLNKAKLKNNKINYDIVDLSKYLPYKNEEFDKINCSQVLKHIEDINTTISEFFRILKK